MPSQKVLMIVNPESGRRRGRILAERADKVLAFGSISSDVRLTEYPGHATELCSSLNLADYRGICIVGGDGTIHEVVNGLMNRNASTSPPLGLIPAGTGNSLCHQLGFEKPMDGLDPILACQVRPLDLLRVRLNGAESYCMHMIGWGAAASIASRAEKMRWMGPGRYSLAALAEILIAKPMAASIIVDDEIIRDEFNLAIGCNTQQVGSGMKMAPMASIGDGYVDLILVRRVSRIQMVNLFRMVQTGAHVNLPYVECYRAKRFRIESAQPSNINLDGDVDFEKISTLEVEVVPHALEVFAGGSD